MADSSQDRQLCKLSFEDDASCPYRRPDGPWWPGCLVSCAALQAMRPAKCGVYGTMRRKATCRSTRYA